MRLSIALATCNGERYLPEQLNSFVSQRRRPDEVVICDDRSTDRTPEVLAEFAATAPFAVAVHRNEQRLGITKNFERAARLCTGDLIFFSDQDDLWLPEKLARHEEAHLAGPEFGMVYGDGTVVDSDLRPTGPAMLDLTGMTPPRRRRLEGRRAFDLMLRRPFIFGCLMSFRAEFMDLLIPFPDEFLHDSWVQTMLSACTRMRGLPGPLMLYRRHAAQVVGQSLGRPSGPADSPRVDAIDSQIRSLTALLERLDQFAPRLLGRDYRARVAAKLAHLRRRRSLGRSAAADLLVIARELLAGHYLRYGAHPKSEVLQDLREGTARRVSTSAAPTEG